MWKLNDVQVAVILFRFKSPKLVFVIMFYIFLSNNYLKSNHISKSE